MFSVPVELADPAIIVTALPVFTVPPFWIVSVPVPELPIKKRPELIVQDEPAPVTVTVPVEPEPSPMVPPPPLLTLPPFWIVSVPAPLSPTGRRPELVVQDDPAPVTVTVPVPPKFWPMKLPPVLTVPPFWIVSLPLPKAPTVKLPKLVPVEP